MVLAWFILWNRIDSTENETAASFETFTNRLSKVALHSEYKPYVFNESSSNIGNRSKSLKNRTTKIDLGCTSDGFWSEVYQMIPRCINVTSRSILGP